MASKIEKDVIRATVGMLRINYPKGTRVERVKMDDMQAPPLGTHGSKFGVVLGEDTCRKIK